MPTITFRETAKVAALVGKLRPDFSITSLPKWLKAIPKTVPPDPGQYPIGTARACMPFFDAMTAGYMLTLTEALYVTHPDDSDVVQFSWRRAELGQLIEMHGDDQLPEPLRTKNGVYKFVQPWGFKVPEGHSVLYTHPLNRHDLPFRSFSGIVDGTYEAPVNIPFVWLGEQGDPPVILDAGTPIAQVIPFLREEWESDSETVSDDALDADGFAANTHDEGYRKMFRRPKVWR